MNLKYQLFILIITIFSQFCTASKFNKSLSDYEVGCEVYNLENSASGYNDFFEISSINKKIEKKNERLHFKFYVIRITDGYVYIRLSEVDNRGWLDENKNRGYDIGLGHPSWVKDSTGHIVFKDSPNLLSKVKPTPVEIIQTKDNEVIVNIPGYSEPFIKYSDNHSVNIKFLSFEGYEHLTKVKWFYNCTFDENSYIGDQKISENEVKTVETEKTDVNQQQLSEQPKSTLNPTEKNNEKQLTSKLSAIDSCLNDLSPILDNFDVNQMLDFKLGVLELIKKLKNPPTTTTEKPVAIDVRFGSRENEVKTVETKKTNVNQQQLSEDQKMPENEVKTVETKKTNVNQQQLSEDQKMPENEVKTDETKKTNVNQQQLSEDQKMPENEVKTVETKKTNVNQQQLSQQPKSTANPTETRPFSRHNSFFDLLVPMLVKFDDNKMLDFKLGVLELIKKLKNPPTTTTEKPVAIDVRIDDSEESS
ncbi:uncharacterized protein LOC129915613 isoform X1 [Episyrphus balteatus]|uniref:uncharacterized protein LOC129915613 isoform X1 n=1 Tax=Episyrphus balteatus TaxID=286459 RepID=UPI00248506BC|nr:uncharacterized protein LOC129915613 isoform X1 [Episyrphus balteatus]